MIDRADYADHVRDSKKEEVTCAHGICTTSHGLREGPKGYTGQYGGHMLCEKHYEKIVDHILEHGCLPSER